MQPAVFAPSSLPALPLHVVAADQLAAWRAEQPAAVSTWLDAVGFKASLGETVVWADAQGALAGAVVGAGSAVAQLRQRFGLSRAVAALPEGSCWRLVSALSGAQQDEFALGWLLACYRFERYRPQASAKLWPQLQLPQGCDRARLEAIAAGEWLTRDLINTPASDMGPQELEDVARSLAARFSARLSVTCGDDLLSENFPLIHTVGRASNRAPRLLDLRWGEVGPKLVLVGKGVCFDTGGLDLKPSSGMLLMKKDMGGAATVLGLAQMIMSLGLPLQLRVLIPAVENAVSGNAMRPRDIVTSRKGLTVEINNTDAEGRLVLADALALASEEESDLVISMATLTGAARVAVGPDLAPYFTDAVELVAPLEAAATAVRDPVWRLPLWPGYEAMIEPGIADLDNAPAGGFAGAVTAALFLRRFVDQPRYLHFDIYGHNPNDAPARPKGGVGQAARAVLEALPKMLTLS